MGKITPTDKVKLIVGIISKELTLFKRIKSILCSKYENIDLESRIMDFNHTTYYNEEMGENLKRKFLAFEKLIFPEEISNIKQSTNEIESNFLYIEGGRKINLDPGYVSDSKLVLATTKNYSHRIYLKDGIYAEVTLYYKKGSFRSFDWTYPDYRTKEYIDFFNEVRDKYMKQIKSYK